MILSRTQVRGISRVRVMPRRNFLPVGGRADTEAFDPLIEVMAASGRDGPPMATDDDSGPGLSAFLIFEAPVDGDYIVRVYALSPEGHGPYILRIAD